MKLSDNRAGALAITGFEGLDVGGRGLSIARALRAERGEEAVLLALTSESSASAGLMDGATDATAKVSGLAAHGGEAVDQILALNKVFPIRALLPGTDEHARIFAPAAERLAAEGIGTFLPPPELFERLTPSGLREYLGHLPIEIMSSGSFASIEEAMDCAEVLAFPTMVIARGQRRVVWSASDLRAHLKRIANGAGTKVRAVPVDSGFAYRVACLAQDGVVGPLVVTRILGSTAAGAVAASTVVHDSYFNDLAGEIVAGLGWTGPLELELRRWSDASPVGLLWAECNLPDWSMLTHWAGCNLPGALLARIETGKFVGGQQVRAGTMGARCTYETVLPAETHAAFMGESIVRHAPRALGIARSEAAGPSVAVTGLSNSDIINPGVGVSRALRAGTVVGDLIGIGYTSLDAAAYDSALYDQVFRFDFPRTEGNFRAQVLNAARTAKIDVLLPCLDDELVFAIAVADELRDHGIATLLPSAEALERRSKPALFGGTLKSDWGAFVVPKSLVIRDEEGARAASAYFHNAAVAKGARYTCTSVGNPSEAAAAWRRMLHQDADSRVIFQERLDGPSYAVSVVCDRDHDVVSSLTIRKETLCPRGSTWGAVSVSEPALEAAFAELLGEIGWTGPAEGEFMLDQRSGRFHLIEVNPRFTGWISSAPVMGPNQPQIAVQLALGLSFEAPNFTPGKLFLRAADEVRIPASKLSNFATRRTFRHDRA